MINTGGEGPLRVQNFEIFGSSQNGPLTIAICPGTLISHFGIIETPKRAKNTIKNQKKNETPLIFFQNRIRGKQSHPNKSLTTHPNRYGRVQGWESVF